MKPRSLLLLCLAVFFILPMSAQAVPRTVVGELGSTTWCVYCPNAVAGLTACEDNFFDRSEFIWIEYLGSSGGLSCPESDTRLDYYDVNSYPTTIFDGVERFSSGSADLIDGTIFAATIDDRLALESPLSVSVTSYRFFGTDPYITVEVEVFEELASIENTNLRIGFCENDLVFGSSHYHNTLRTMLDDIPLTVQHVGEVQEVTLPLTISSAWDLSEFWAFAMVQRDSDQEILNAGSTYVTPYALSLETDGGQSAIIDGLHTFGQTEITHTGAAESHTIDISIDTSTLPEGWDAYFTYGGEDLTSTTVTLAQFEIARLNVTLVPGDEAYHGRAMLNLHSHSGEMPDSSVPFAGVRLGASLLVAAGDDGSYADEYFAPAIESTGRSYAVWYLSSTALEATTMQNFDAVIWYSGDTGPGLTESEQGEIETYLADGGTIFFSGQNLAAATALEGGSTWMITTLRTFYQASAEGGPLVDGMADDPVSDGLSLDLQGGDGAGNYDAPDVVNAFGGSESIFTYSGTGRSAATRVEYNGYKLIFLGFGFESINAAADREALMANSLNWLVGAPSPVEDLMPPMASLYQNLPNPFNPQTTIFFDLPGQMAVSLRVYDLSGRLVDVLLDNEIAQQGRNEVIWRGEDAGGRSLPSGTYFYRLEGQNFGDTKRMTLVK